MGRYRYEATNSSGEARRGTLDAESLPAAVQALESDGLSVATIHLVPEQIAKREDLEQAFYARVEQALMRSKSWTPVFSEMLPELQPAVARQQAERLIQTLEANPTLESLVENRSASRMMPALLRESTDGGFAEGVFQWLTDVSEQLEFRSKSRRAMFYPLLLFSMAALIFVLFSYFVIPIYAQMYAEFGLSLPESTKLVIWSAEQVTRYLPRTLLILIVLAFAAFFGVRFWREHSFSNRLFGSLAAGSVANLQSMATLVGTLAELLNLGAPIDVAMRYAGQCSGSRFYRNAMQRVASYLASAEESSAIDDGSAEQGGEARIRSAPGAQHLPPLVLFALQQGEGKPPSVPLLRELADMYRAKCRRRLDWVSIFLPIGGVIAAGVVSGFVVLTLFMPLISMISSLS